MDEDIETFKFDVNPDEISNVLNFQSRLDEIEQEAHKLKSLQESYTKEDSNDNSLQVEFNDATAENANSSLDLDSRSIYIGNVDYSTTANEIEQHFSGFGKINRVTIQCDKFSSRPKGFAYVEFALKESVENSLTLCETLFKGRLIKVENFEFISDELKVSAKRTNIPGISTSDRGSRGRFRGGRARGRGRGRFSRSNRFRRGPY